LRQHTAANLSLSLPSIVSLVRVDKRASFLERLFWSSIAKLLTAERAVSWSSGSSWSLQTMELREASISDPSRAMILVDLSALLMDKKHSQAA